MKASTPILNFPDPVSIWRISRAPAPEGEGLPFVKACGAAVVGTVLWLTVWGLELAGMLWVRALSSRKR